jgi:hypothetical protein
MVTFASPIESTTRLPAGEYVMLLKDIEEAEVSTFNPDVQRLKFIFTVQSVEVVDVYPDGVDWDDDAMEEFDQSLVGNEHWAWCSNKMGGNSTLRGWLTGMMGRTLEKLEVPEPTQFIGKPYKVTLGMKPYVIQQSGASGEKFDILTIKPYKAPRQRTRTPKSNEENLAPWERDDDE